MNILANSMRRMRELVAVLLLGSIGLTACGDADRKPESSAGDVVAEAGDTTARLARREDQCRREHRTKQQ